VLLTAANKQPTRDFRQIDLMHHNDERAPIDIVRSLAAGDFDIDASELFLQ
jgi:hypothetical protein